MADGETETLAGVASSASIPEFVRKLFRMLDDPTSAEVVEWAEDGNSFVVKDTNEFSKEVLPRHFKHNNFASFVRQLNKYDFHKVKVGPDDPKPYGDLAWEFKHPHFTLHNVDQLSNIRRKSASTKKATSSNVSDASAMASAVAVSREPNQALTGVPQDMLGVGVVPGDVGAYLQTLSKNYETVVRDLLMVKRNMAVQDQLMQQLLQYLINKESGAASGLPSSIQALAGVPGMLASSGYDASAAGSSMQPPAQRLVTPLLPSHQQQQQQPQNPLIPPSPQMGINMTVPPPLPSPGPAFGAPLWSPAELPSFAASAPLDSFGTGNYPHLSEVSTSAMEELSRRYSNNADGNLTVTTLGMLRKREGPSPPPGGNKVRVVRQSFVPSWSVPPKVLLVEDDATCRMVASKLLQVAGCKFEIAHDGIEAVNKMNLDKYDIVLMDIFMPNMDGISATTQIRQFDSATPVISMTTNTSRDDCLKYFETGMNDVLGKPFSKDMLVEMIQRYCSHLGLLQREGVADITEEEEFPANKRVKADPSSS